MFFESVRTNDQRLLDLRTKYPAARPKLRHWFHGSRMKEELVLDRSTMIGFDGVTTCIDEACTQMELAVDVVSILHHDTLTPVQLDPPVVHLYVQHYRVTDDGTLYRHVLGPFGYSIFKRSRLGHL